MGDFIPHVPFFEMISNRSGCMAKRPFLIICFLVMIGLPIVGVLFPSLRGSQYGITVFFIIIGTCFVLDYYFSVMRQPLIATKAKLIKRYTGYKYDYDYFKLPDKSTIKLRTSSWKQISSETKVGDIVIIKYKGWLLKSIEKVNIDSSSKTSSTSPKPAKHTPKPVIVKDKRWD